MPLESGPRAPGAFSSPRNQDSTPTPGSHFHSLSHTVRTKPAMLSECPYWSPCSSIEKEPQCAQVGVVCSVPICACWGSKAWLCVSIWLLCASIQNTGFECEFVWCMGLCGCSTCMRLLCFCRGEDSGRGSHKMSACSCRYAVLASACVQAYLCRSVGMCLGMSPQSRRPHTPALASLPPYPMSTSLWQDGWVLSYLTGELASAFLTP